MRHVNTRALAQYWETIRRGRIAPARSDVSPAELAGLLSHLFILQRVDQDHAVFRLAGTGLCDLYRREFRDHNFLSLWRGADRDHMRALLSAASTQPAPTGALARAETIDGAAMDAEVLLAPLLSPNGKLDRFIGLYQPMKDEKILRGRPLVSQRLMAVYPPMLRGAARPAPKTGAEPRPRLRVVASNEL